MGEVGCYTLDLYCDHPGHCRYRHGNSPGQFAGRTYAACLREARAYGWYVSRDRHADNPAGNGSGRCLCPRHNPRSKHYEG